MPGVAKSMANACHRQELLMPPISVQLYWPDDGNWYGVTINAINVKKRSATCVPCDLYECIYYIKIVDVNLLNFMHLCSMGLSSFGI
jgi:hypothetical protein